MREANEAYLDSLKEYTYDWLRIQNACVGLRRPYRQLRNANSSVSRNGGALRKTGSPSSPNTLSANTARGFLTPAAVIRSREPC